MRFSLKYGFIVALSTTVIFTGCSSKKFDPNFMLNVQSAVNSRDPNNLNKKQREAYDRIVSAQDHNRTMHWIQQQQIAQQNLQRQKSQRAAAIAEKERAEKAKTSALRDNLANSPNSTTGRVITLRDLANQIARSNGVDTTGLSTIEILRRSKNAGEIRTQELTKTVARLEAEEDILKTQHREQLGIGIKPRKESLGRLYLENGEQDLDCVDFYSWSDAQKFYETNLADHHNLDDDNDGIACEHLK